MRKRLNGQWIFGLVLMLVVLLTACGQNVETKWQEQYDLGIKYLSEGNYEEAIIAFTEAIKVDPKQAPAYVKLSEAYKGQGNMDQAKKILEDGLTVCGENTELQVKLEALESLPQGDYGIYYTADLVKPQEMTIGGSHFGRQRRVILKVFIQAEISFRLVIFRFHSTVL